MSQLCCRAVPLCPAAACGACDCASLRRQPVAHCPRASRPKHLLPPFSKKLQPPRIQPPRSKLLGDLQSEKGIAEQRASMALQLPPLPPLPGAAPAHSPPPPQQPQQAALPPAPVLWPAPQQPAVHPGLQVQSASLAGPQQQQDQPSLLPAAWPAMPQQAPLQPAMLPPALQQQPLQLDAPPWQQPEAAVPPAPIARHPLPACSGSPRAQQPWQQQQQQQQQQQWVLPQPAPRPVLEPHVQRQAAAPHPWPSSAPTPTAGPAANAASPRAAALVPRGSAAATAQRPAAQARTTAAARLGFVPLGGRGRGTVGPAAPAPLSPRAQPAPQASPPARPKLPHSRLFVKGLPPDADAASVAALFK